MPSLCHTVLFNKQRKCHNLVCLVHSLFYCLVFCIKTAPKMLCLVPNCIYKAPNGPLQTLSCTPGWSQCLTSPHSGPSCSHQGLTPQWAPVCLPSVPSSPGQVCSVSVIYPGYPDPQIPVPSPKPPPRPLEIVGFRHIYCWNRQVLGSDP